MDIFYIDSIYFPHLRILGAPQVDGISAEEISPHSLRLHDSTGIFVILSPMSVLSGTHTSSNAPQAKRFTTIILWKKWKLTEIFDVVEPRESAQGTFY